MKERAIKIGRPSPLIGVVCEPEKIDSEQPAVLIFNSGVMHHIGSCRLSVKLARSFAESGVLSIRFDFSGIGDSNTRRGDRSFSETAPIEAKEIMDYLQAKRGIKQFILYGLCSGADAAYETALVEERVVAYSQIDPYCYRNARFYYHSYKSRIFKMKCWVSFSKRMVNKVVRFNSYFDNLQDRQGDEYLESASYIRQFPPKEEIQKGLKTLIDRGVFMNIIFTGSEDDYGYPNQYRESFKHVDFDSYLDLHYFDKATHIITHPDHQLMVVKAITDWLVLVVDQIKSRR
jgi:hypothetical protein